MKLLAWIVGALVVALIAAFVWGRLRPPQPAQAEAIELLQPTPAPHGRNAWANLWLLDYDVPADRIDAVYAQERAHMQDWASQLPANPSTTAATYKPLVAAQYPKRPVISETDHKLLCAIREDDCLAKVRAGGQPLRDLLVHQASRLTQIEAMNAADMLWDDRPINSYVYAQLPAFTHTEDLLLTAAAVDFVDGRQAQALAAVCRQAGGVRRMHAHTNALVTAMVTNAWVEAVERMLAGMLRELPSDQVVPSECMQAFAPPTQADVSLCAPMQYEFEGVANTSAMPLDPKQGSRIAHQGYRVAIDPQGTRRLLAPAYAWACRQEVQAAALEDRPLSAGDVPGLHYDMFDLVSNAAGVILARVAVPAHAQYAQYAIRNEDYATGLRVTAWLLQTRGIVSTAGEWKDRLAQALPKLREGGSREIGIDPDGRFLRMRYYAPRAGRSELVLPLMK